MQEIGCATLRSALTSGYRRLKLLVASLLLRICGSRVAGFAARQVAIVWFWQHDWTPEMGNGEAGDGASCVEPASKSRKSIQRKLKISLCGCQRDCVHRLAGE